MNASIPGFLAGLGKPYYIKCYKSNTQEATSNFIIHFPFPLKTKTITLYLRSSVTRPTFNSPTALSHFYHLYWQFYHIGLPTGQLVCKPAQHQPLYHCQFFAQRHSLNITNVYSFSKLVLSSHMVCEKQEQGERDQEF